MRNDARWNWDRVGTYASAICAVHCLLTGVALGLLSVMGLGFLGSPITEAAFFIVAVVVGVAALVHGRRKHHSVLPALIFVSGMASLLISHFVFGHGHEGGHSSPGGTFFAVLGGASLVIFHVVNRTLQHRCGCSHCATGE